MLKYGKAKVLADFFSPYHTTFGKYVLGSSPLLYYMQVQQQSNAAGDKLSQGESVPCIAQPQLRKKPEQRQQAYDLPQQRERQTGAAITDGLKKHRHDE